MLDNGSETLRIWNIQHPQLPAMGEKKLHPLMFLRSNTKIWKWNEIKHLCILMCQQQFTLKENISDVNQCLIDCHHENRTQARFSASRRRPTGNVWARAARDTLGAGRWQLMRFFLPSMPNRILYFFLTKKRNDIKCPICLLILSLPFSISLHTSLSLSFFRVFHSFSISLNYSSLALSLFVDFLHLSLS